MQGRAALSLLNEGDGLRVDSGQNGEAVLRHPLSDPRLRQSLHNEANELFGVEILRRHDTPIPRKSASQRMDYSPYHGGSGRENPKGKDRPGGKASVPDAEIPLGRSE